MTYHVEKRVVCLRSKVDKGRVSRETVTYDVVNSMTLEVVEEGLKSRTQAQVSAEARNKPLPSRKKAA